MKRSVNLHSFILTATGLLAAALYSLQTWWAIHTLRSPMDEGAFVVKGLAFASGQVIPYQPFSYWLTKMPFSFLIPGWILQFFEPGIASTRYFAFGVSLLFLLGFFLLLLRESNRYWAVAGLWVLALNPIWIKTYAVANSQGLAACLLIWAFYFFFGQRRNHWQIGVGAALSAILVMTRENMLPVFLFVWIYTFFRYRRSFWVAILASLLPLIVVHALYFPNILANWFSWVPISSLRSALYQLFRIDQLADHRLNDGDPLIFSRITAFMEGIRIYLVVFLGVCLAGAAYFGNKIKQRRFDFYALLALFWLLVAMHAWASIGKDYCIYCFQNYLAFFIALGLLLIGIAATQMPSQAVKKPFFMLAVSVISTVTIVILSAYKDFYKTRLFEWIYETLWKFPIPRMRGFERLEGMTDLKSLMINKFELDIDVALKVVYPIITLFGLLLLILAAVALIYWIVRRHEWKKNPPKFWNQALIGFWMLTFLLSPSFLVGNGRFTYQCQNNVISSLEEAGQQLDRIIPAGASVDWRATNGTILLLDLADIRLYPPQLNGYYSYIQNDDSERALKNGRWTPALSREWIQNSDYLVLDSHTKVFPDDVQLGDYYSPVGERINLYYCGDETFWLTVYRKK